MTPAQAAQAMLSSWQWLTAGPAPRLGQTTMVPYTTSSDGWTTATGQTATDVVWRDAINGWLRDGAPLVDGAPALTGGAGAVRAGEVGHPMIGVCDIAAAVETPNPTGLVWDTSTGVPTPDGTHPTRIGSNLMEPIAAQWSHDHLTWPGQTTSTKVRIAAATTPVVVSAFATRLTQWVDDSREPANESRDPAAPPAPKTARARASCPSVPFRHSPSPGKRQRRGPRR